MNDDFLKKLMPTLDSNDKEALTMATDFTRDKNRQDFSLEIRMSLETIKSDRHAPASKLYLENSTLAFEEVLGGLEGLGLKVNPLAKYHHDKILTDFFNQPYLQMLLESHADKEPVFLAFFENYEWDTSDEMEQVWYADYEVDVVLFSGDFAYPLYTNAIVLTECKIAAEDYEIDDEDED